jgi:hypothetical protein
MSGDKITFTEARLPAEFHPRHAGKTWFKEADGTLDKTDFTAPRMLVWREVEKDATPDALRDYLVALAGRADTFVIRGGLSDRTRRKPTVSDRPWAFGGWVAPRLLTAGHGDAGSLDDAAQQWACVDLDDATLPEGWSFVDDPDTAVQWVVAQLLPPEFQGVSVVWQLSSSAGVKGDPREVKAHLWYLLDDPLDCVTLREWAKWWNQERGAGKVVDPQVFVPTQPHYTAPPRFTGGVINPFPDPAARIGLVRGERDRLALRVPDEAERRATAERAKADAKASAAARGVKGKVHSEDGYVRFGPGYRGWLRGVGYNGEVRAYVKKAAYAYFGEHGAEADIDALLAEIQQAVAGSPWLECDETWARGRSHAQGYIDSGNFAEIARDAQRKEARKAQERAAAPCPHPDFGVSLYEGEKRVQEVVDDFLDRIVPDALAAREQNARDVAEWIDADTARRERAREGPQNEFLAVPDADALFDGAEVPAASQRPSVPLYEPPQIGLRVSTGVGKTEAALRMVVRAVEAGYNVAYFAPTHDLLAELKARADKIAGREIGHVYRGRSQLDPEVCDGETTMCRQLRVVAAAEQAGGSLADVCRECPFSLKNAGSGPVCGLHRQRAVESRLWLMPTTLLRNRRQPGVPKPDLVVIDEAAWLDFARLSEAFDPWSIVKDGGLPADGKATESERAAYRVAVDKLKAGLPDALAGRGYMLVKALREAGMTAVDADRAAQLEWRRLDGTADREAYRAAIREAIKTGDEAAFGTLRRSASTSTVRQRVAFWRAIECALWQGADRAAGVYVETGGKVVLQGVSALDADWVGGETPRRRRGGEWVVELPDDGPRGAPVLYMDATMTPAVVRQFLPRLDPHEVRVEAEHARRILVNDRTLAATTIDPKSKAAKADPDVRKTAENHVDDFANILEVAAAVNAGRGRDYDALLVSNKGVEETLRDRHGDRLGGRVGYLHFGALAGVDAYKDTPIAFVIGRHQLPVGALERTAAAVFGRVPRSLPEGEALPKREVRVRTADRSLATAKVETHPDPDVRAIIEATTTAELQQAEGRARAVRRGPDDPVVIVMASSSAAACDLTYHATVAWEDIVAARPVIRMQHWGLIPCTHRDHGRIWHPGAQDPGDAARQALAHPPSYGAAVRQLRAGKTGPIPYNISLWDQTGFLPTQWRKWSALFDGDTKRGSFLIDTAKHPTDPHRRAALERYVGLPVAELAEAADTAAKRDTETVDDPPKPTPADRPEPAAPPAPGPDAHEPRAAAPQHHDRPEKNVDHTPISMEALLAELGLPSREYAKLAQRAAKRRGVAGRFKRGRASRDDLAAIDMMVWETVLARPDVTPEGAKAAARRVAAATARAA